MAVEAAMAVVAEGTIPALIVCPLMESMSLIPSAVSPQMNGTKLGHNGRKQVFSMRDSANSEQSASGTGRGGQGRGRGGAVAASEACIQAIETASFAPTQISEVTTDQTNANQTGTGSRFGRGLQQLGCSGHS